MRWPRALQHFLLLGLQFFLGVLHVALEPLLLFVDIPGKLVALVLRHHRAALVVLILELRDLALAGIEFLLLRSKLGIEFLRGLLAVLGANNRALNADHPHFGRRVAALVRQAQGRINATAEIKLLLFTIYLQSIPFGNSSIVTQTVQAQQWQQAKTSAQWKSGI